MAQPHSDAALQEALWLYERIAIRGTRDALVLDWLTLLPSASVQQRLRVLMALGLLEVERGEVRLPPIDRQALVGAAGLDDAVVRRLVAQQRYWDEWHPARDDGAVLHGARGYWEHWWTVLEGWGPEPMAMDAVMPARPGFWNRNWLEFIHREWLAQLTTEGRQAVRLIVPAGTVGSVATDLVDLVFANAGEVRVLDSPEWYTVYGGSALVIPEELGDDFDGDCRLVRQRQVVAAFRERFERQWAAARPWGAAASTVPAQVLELLAEGLEDEEIATRLGITTRTVRRHVAKAMAAAGARTRFQLGALYVGARATPRPLF